MKPGCFVLGPAPRHLRHHRHHHNIDSARPRVASGWPLLSTAAPRNTFRCSRASSPPWEKYGKARKRKVQQGLSRTRPRFQAKLASLRQKWKLTESQILANRVRVIVDNNGHRKTICGKLVIQGIYRQTPRNKQRLVEEELLRIESLFYCSYDISYNTICGRSQLQYCQLTTSSA